MSRRGQPVGNRFMGTRGSRHNAQAVAWVASGRRQSISRQRDQAGRLLALLCGALARGAVHARIDHYIGGADGHLFFSLHEDPHMTLAVGQGWNHQATVEHAMIGPGRLDGQAGFVRAGVCRLKFVAHRARALVSGSGGRTKRQSIAADHQLDFHLSIDRRSAGDVEFLSRASLRRRPHVDRRHDGQPQQRIANQVEQIQMLGPLDGEVRAGRVEHLGQSVDRLAVSVAASERSIMARLAASSRSPTVVHRSWK